MSKNETKKLKDEIGHDVVVTNPFLDYKRGDMITSTDEINNIMALGYGHFVNKVITKRG